MPKLNRSRTGKFISLKEKNRRDKVSICRKKSAHTDEVNCCVGRRIVNIKHVGLEMWCLACDIPLSFKDIEDETRQGLISVFYVRCRVCLELKAVSTDTKTATEDQNLNYINLEADKGNFFQILKQHNVSTVARDNHLQLEDNVNDSHSYENTSVGVEVFIKEEVFTNEDLMSEEDENSSEAVEVDALITEEPSDVRTTANIKEERVKLEDLQFQENENFSKRIEVTSSNPEELSYNVEAWTTIVNEDSQQRSLSTKEELLPFQASENVSTTFDYMTSDVGRTSFDLSFTGNAIKRENLEIDDEIEDGVGCVAQFEEEERNLIAEEFDIPAISSEPGTSAGSAVTLCNRESARDGREQLGNTQSHKKTYTCISCCRSFNSEYRLTCHRKAHVRENLFRCAHCENGFVTKDILKIHLIAHAGKKESYTCDVCGKTFNNKNNLDTHVRIHDAEQPFECHLCSKRFALKLYLSNHLKTHNTDRPYLCHLCTKGFKWRGGLVRHLKSHTGEAPYQCDLCLKKLRHKVSLIMHLRNHDRGENLKCHLCPNIFANESSFKRHLTTHGIGEIFNCHLCSKSYMNKLRLKCHLKTHGLGRTLECHFCLSKFRDETVLNEHYKTHAGGLPYECIVCLERFTDEHSLNEHTKDHDAEKQFKCHLCSKKFSNKNSLPKHLRNCHQERSFGCKICGKTYKQKCGLTTHLRTHTGEKPYECSICNWRFISNSNLNKHMKCHSGERRFPCHICLKRFSQSSNLKTHLRTHNVT